MVWEFFQCLCLIFLISWTARFFLATKQHHGCSLSCLLPRKAPVLLTQLLLSTPILILLFRMGLEALVESYAFWRPSLRTLTFEDIPGIPKQGKSQPSSHIKSQFLPRSSALKNMQVIISIHSGDLGTGILPLQDPPLSGWCGDGPGKMALWS